MGCPVSVKKGQRWRYYIYTIEVTKNDEIELHGRIVTINGTPNSDTGYYHLGMESYWVSNVRDNYGVKWEYLEGQDAPDPKK